MGLRFRKRLRLTPALALALCASYAFAGPSVRVSIDADGSGLILQAYTACLRNTPGVQVVPLDQKVLVQIRTTLDKEPWLKDPVVPSLTAPK